MDHVIIIPQDYFSNLTKISKYIKIRDIEKGIKEVLESNHHDTFKIQLYIQLFERYLRKAAKPTTPPAKPPQDEKDKVKKDKTVIPPITPSPAPPPPPDNSILATLIDTPQASTSTAAHHTPVKKSKQPSKPYGTPRSLLTGLRRESRERTTAQEDALNLYLKKRFKIPVRKLMSSRRKLDIRERYRTDRKTIEQEWQGTREKLPRKAKNK
jgi:hypothetical protein